MFWFIRLETLVTPGVPVPLSCLVKISDAHVVVGSASFTRNLVSFLEHTLAANPMSRVHRRTWEKALGVGLDKPAAANPKVRQVEKAWINLTGMYMKRSTGLEPL